MVRTRMPGGVGGKAREGLPIPIDTKKNKKQGGRYPDSRFFSFRAHGASAGIMELCGGAALADDALCFELSCSVAGKWQNV